MRQGQRQPPVRVIFHSRRGVRYGLNVLAGALEELEAAGIAEARFSSAEGETARLAREAARRGRDCAVCFSSRTPEFPEIASSARKMREEGLPAGATLIAGGPHPAARPEETLRAGFDLAAFGEGEETIRELARALAENRSAETVRGLARLDGDRLRRARRPEPADLDRFPPFAARHRRFNPIEITRGCVYACRFCQTPFLFGARFRHRSLEATEEAIRRLRAHGLRDVRFITPSALSYGAADASARLEKVEELLERARRALGPGGRIFFGSFPSEIRPEHLTREAARLLRRFAANDNLIVGAQSGSDRMLRLAGRGHTAAQAEEAVRTALEAGFKVNVDFIFGMPGEEEADRRATLALMRRLAARGARIHAHAFMPLPGTPWAGRPPSAIPPSWQRALGELSAAGKLYGQWARQARLATRLAEERNRGVFPTP